MLQALDLGFGVECLECRIEGAGSGMSFRGLGFWVPKP